MNQWASHNPEAYERGEGPPDYTELWDLAEDGPCPVCGEVITRKSRTCERCKRNIEEDRMNRGE